MNVDNLIMDIKKDTSSGASELMIKAIECLKTFSADFEGTKPQNFFEGMVDIGRQLIKAQPSMAPIFNAVNTILLEIEKNLKIESSVGDLKKIVISTAEQLVADSKNALKNIQRHTYTLIEKDSSILTHSYSSTVIKSLLFAHEEGKDFHVIVTESRPKLEGRKTANILSESGIEITLIADMAAFHFMDDIDLTVTGCDCVCYKGFVNKIGTKGLAIAASHYDVPFFILTEKCKFLPSKYMDEPEIEEKDLKEILKEGKNIQVKNIYFDLTPHNYVKGFITEDGFISTEEVQKLLTDLEVCEGLVKL